MKKKLGIIILILLIIPLIVYPLLFGGFSLENFQEVMEVKLGDQYKFNYGSICYKSFFKCHKVSLDAKGMVNTSVLGEYPIYYTFTYQNQTLKKKQIVKVVEDEPPVLTILEDNLTICPNQKEIKFKVSAYDNYDKDLTAKVIQYQEGNKMHFEVTDSSGNKTALVKDLIINDNAPSLKLNGNSETYVKLNDAYNELGATAYDDCDGDLTAKIVVSGKVDTSKAGEYLLTYKVTDSSQNTQSITRKVYVFDGNNTPSNKTIYLTFDDGPSAYTAQLLDVLKKYNIKATFFVTNPKGYDAIIKREYDEGHTIGLHSDTHDYSKIYQNPESYFNDLYTIQNKVKEITGYTSTIIRFPGGSSNTVSRSYDQGTKIMTLLAKEVEEKGFHYFDWNISSGDAGLTTSTSEVIYNIVSNLGNKEMYVVLQHDTKSYSVAAVEEVIKYGLAHGYNFKPLTMDTPVIHHHIAN